MDTEELEVRAPMSRRTHQAHLIFLVSWVPIWFIGGGWLKRSEEASFPTLTMLLSLPVSQQAVEVMCFVPKRCNDMMTLGRLRGFEVREWSREFL